MEVIIHKIDGLNIAEVVSGKIEIAEVQDALDLMADIDYRDSRKLIINEKNLTGEFFDLKTGLAGEILQKFTNYKVELAIIGDFSKYMSKSLRNFIYESNRHGKIMFLPSKDEALEKLSQ